MDICGGLSGVWADTCNNLLVVAAVVAVIVIFILAVHFARGSHNE